MGKKKKRVHTRAGHRVAERVILALSRRLPGWRDLSVQEQDEFSLFVNRLVTEELRAHGARAHREGLKRGEESE